MRELNKFNTPISVKMIAYLFLIFSPIIVYFILFKYNFHIDRSISIQGILVDNKIISKEKKGIEYQNIECIFISNRNYTMNHFFISKKHVFIYLNTKEKHPNLNTEIILRIKEEKTLIKLLFN